MAFNPFRCKSEGMRRLTVTAFLLVVAAWVGWVWQASDGFARVRPTEWPVLFAVPLAAWVLILGIKILVLWIVAGFKVRP